MDGNKTSLPNYLSAQNAKGESGNNNVLKFLLEEKKRLGENPYLNLLIEGIRKGSLDPELARDSYEKYLIKEGHAVQGHAAATAHQHYHDDDAKTRLPYGPGAPLAPSRLHDSSSPSKSPLRGESSRNPFATSSPPSPPPPAPHGHGFDEETSGHAPGTVADSGLRQKLTMSQRQSRPTHPNLFADFDIPEYSSNVPGVGEQSTLSKKGAGRVSIRTLVDSLDEQTHKKEEMPPPVDYDATRASRLMQHRIPPQENQTDASDYYHETRLPGDFMGGGFVPHRAPDADYERVTQADEAVSLGSAPTDFEAEASIRARGAFGSTPIGQALGQAIRQHGGETSTVESPRPKASSDEDFQLPPIEEGLFDGGNTQADAFEPFVEASDSATIPPLRGPVHPSQMTSLEPPPGQQEGGDMYDDEEETRIIGRSFKDDEPSASLPPQMDELPETTERLRFDGFDLERLFDQESAAAPLGIEPTECESPQPQVPRTATGTRIDGLKKVVDAHLRKQRGKEGLASSSPPVQGRQEGTWRVTPLAPDSSDGLAGPNEQTSGLPFDTFQPNAHEVTGTSESKRPVVEPPPSHGIRPLEPSFAAPSSTEPPVSSAKPPMAPTSVQPPKGGHSSPPPGVGRPSSQPSIAPPRSMQRDRTVPPSSTITPPPFRGHSLGHPTPSSPPPSNPPTSAQEQFRPRPQPPASPPNAEKRPRSSAPPPVPGPPRTKAPSKAPQAIAPFSSDEDIPEFVVPFTELSQRGISIDHRMAYALSQVDGYCCIRDICDIVGIPVQEMLHSLNDLASQHIVKKK